MSFEGIRDVRAAYREEIDALADLWYKGWQDAHATLLPEALARTRTLENFRERMTAAFSSTRVTGPRGAPTGLCMLKGDELNQIYVSAEARGIGVASALIADAESRLAAGGVKTAWLTCAIGNNRAARFYEKSGWQSVGTVLTRLDTMNGPFDLEAWRYEKHLSR